MPCWELTSKRRDPIVSWNQELLKKSMPWREKNLFLCRVTWKMFLSAICPGGTDSLLRWCTDTELPGELQTQKKISKVYDFKWLLQNLCSPLTGNIKKEIGTLIVLTGLFIFENVNGGFPISSLDLSAHGTTIWGDRRCGLVPRRMFSVFYGQAANLKGCLKFFPFGCYLETLERVSVRTLLCLHGRELQCPRETSSFPFVWRACWADSSTVLKGWGGPRACLSTVQ